MAEEVGGKHGVERHVGDLDAEVSQERHVVVGLVGDLGEGGVAEDGREPLHHALAGKLRALGVADGDVPGPARRRGEGEAHQVRSQGVYASVLGVDGRGLDVEGEAGGGGEGRDQRVQRRLVGDGGVVALDGVAGGGGGSGGVLVGVVGLAGGHPVDEAEELKAAEELHDVGAAVATPAGGLEVEADGGVAAQRDEVEAEVGGVAMGLQERALPLGHLVEVVVDGLDGAELHEQADGRLLADAGDAGDVVGGVAAQGLEVDELVGGEAAVALADAGLVEDKLLGHAVLEHDADAGGDKLEDVRVAGEDKDVDVLGLRLLAEGAEEVVGLQAVELVDGDLEGLHEAADVGELLCELRGHLRALGLVGLEALVAEGGGGQVERDGEVGGLEVLHGLAEHLGEAVDAADLLAGGADGERTLDGMPGPMDHGMAIQEHQQRLGLQQALGLGSYVCSARPDGHGTTPGKVGRIIARR